MRIDSSLEQALETVNLVGTPTPNGLGIQVTGNVGGKNLLLFKARSYWSPAGKLTRTIIEGGPLLDQLAVVKTTPKLSQAFIIQLKSQYGNLQQLTPAQQKQLNNDVDRLTPSQLKQLADENIKWASDAARLELQRRGIK